MQMYVMSIVIVLFVGVYMLYENNSPDVVSVTIDQTGIRMDQFLYEYAKVASFRIMYVQQTPFLLRIHLREAVAMSSKLDIKLTNTIDSNELRQFLLGYLPEHEI